MQADEVVLSEVHVETCPPRPAGSTWTTRFFYRLDNTPVQLQQPARASQADSEPDSPPDLDSDGDLVLPCRPARPSHSLTILHYLATPISRCGEQVWQGACLLADWVIANRQQLQGQVLVELGAGVGLVSLLAASLGAETVFVTDADMGALKLALCNTAQLAHSPQQQEAVPAAGSSASRHWEPAAAAAAEELVQQHCTRPDVRVRVLDWLTLFDTQLQHLSQAEVLQLLNSTASTLQPATLTPHKDKAEQPQQQQQESQQHEQQVQQQQQQPAVNLTWSAADLERLSRTNLWLAADVVYDTALTDAFMHAAAALMRWQQQQQQPAGTHPTAAAAAVSPAVQPSPRLVVALEKRYNFTLRDMDAVAPAFEHFMTYLEPSHASLAALPDQEQQRIRQQQQQQQRRRCVFKGNRLDADSVPQVRVGPACQDSILGWVVMSFRAGCDTLPTCQCKAVFCGDPGRVSRGEGSGGWGSWVGMGTREGCSRAVSATRPLPVDTRAQQRI